MPFGLFFGLISAFIRSETKSLGEQTHLKSLLGPDFLHLLSLILPSSVYVYLWHQLTKTNTPPPAGRAWGVARKRRKEIQQLFVLRQPGSQTLGGGRARTRGSRCLCVSPSIPLMREASLRDVDAAFGGAILHR